jgi:hypothetical protein
MVALFSRFGGANFTQVGDFGPCDTFAFLDKHRKGMSACLQRAGTTRLRRPRVSDTLHPNS